VNAYEGLEDVELLELVKEKGRDALEALYHRYGNAIYSLSMRMLRSPQAAEEVTQDTFFNVWRRASSYKPGRGSFKSWLFSIAHHRAIDEIRRNKRDRNVVQYDTDFETRAADDTTDPVRYTASRFDVGKIRNALMELRPEQRSIVELAYFGGLTHSEISKKLDQPLGTVKTRMRLALKKLREVLGSQAQEWVEHGL
jgi:RNA polymerase sigma-70 factor (ECF subfamily)